MNWDCRVGVCGLVPETARANIEFVESKRCVRQRCSAMEQTASSASAASPRGLRPEAGFTRSYLVKSERTTAAAVTAPPKPAETISYFAKTGVMKQGRETISYGLLRDPKPLGGKPAPPVSMPDPLVFFSWWNEEVATPVELTPSGQGMGVRRQVRLP